MAKYAKYGQIWYLTRIMGVSQIWSSGVSLKRSCKMQLKHVDIGSKDNAKSILVGRPYCNFYVKLEVTDKKCPHGKEWSYNKNKNCSETSEPRSITWEHAKLDILNLNCKIRIAQLDCADLLRCTLVHNVALRLFIALLQKQPLYHLSSGLGETTYPKLAKP